MNVFTRHPQLSALVLTMALLTAIVGLGLSSVDAEDTPAYTSSDVTVKKAKDGNWYTYTVNTNRKVPYTGVAKNDKGWWRTENGKVNFKATGLYQNDKGWWYCKGGKVQFGHTGFIERNGTFWYVKNGRVQKEYSGAVKATIKKENAWWRITGGKVDFNCNSVEKNENGWWYFKDGKVDFSYTGVAKNDKGWWRIEKGKVNFNYNGVASNEKGSWYIRNGKVDFGYSGAILLDDTVYVIKNGRVTETKEYVVEELPAVNATVKNYCRGSVITWEAFTDQDGKPADGYEIFVKTSPEDAWSKIATVKGTATTYWHNLKFYIDPDTNPRLYDVRAFQKDEYGLLSKESKEGDGTFMLAAPDIVSVKENGALSYDVTFKAVPNAKEYVIYYGKSRDGSLSSMTKAGSAKADPAAAEQKGNQTVTIPKKNGYNAITVQAVNGSRKSAFDEGFLLNQTQLSGKKILFMGDSLIAGTPYGPATADYTIPTRVAMQTGATVYNAAVGGAVLVSDYPRVINNSILHNQNIPVCDGTHQDITSGKWSDVKDMTDFDIVVLEGGANDYWQQVQLGTEDSEDVTTFYGALNKHLSLLREASIKRQEQGKKPIKLILVDCFYIHDNLPENELGLTAADFSEALTAMADIYAGDPDLDIYLYTGTDGIMNAENFQFVTVDRVHPTAFCYGQFGNHLAAFLKTMK